MPASAAAGLAEEDGATSQEMWASVRSWERQGSRVPPEPPCSPAAPLSQRGQSLPRHFLLSLQSVPPPHPSAPSSPPLPVPRVQDFGGLGQRGSQPRGLGVQDPVVCAHLSGAGPVLSHFSCMT